MKYFTKEFYTKVKNVIKAEIEGTYTEGFTPIPDQSEYTEDDISVLYDKALELFIADEKEIYENPYPIDPLDILEESKDDIDPFDFARINEETGDVEFLGDTYEEIKEALIAEKERVLAEIAENPFDEEACAKSFAEMFNNKLDFGVDMPDWVKEKVNEDILALGFLPQSIYDKLKAEEPTEEEIEAARAEGEKLEAELAVEFEKLPSMIKHYFEFGFGLNNEIGRRFGGTCAIDILEKGKDVECHVSYMQMDEYGNEELTGDKFFLRKARFIEDEADFTREEPYAYIMEEIYLREDGMMEMHFLTEDAQGLYSTIVEFETLDF